MAPLKIVSCNDADPIVVHVCLKQFVTKTKKAWMRNTVFLENNAPVMVFEEPRDGRTHCPRASMVGFEESGFHAAWPVNLECGSTGRSATGGLAGDIMPRAIGRHVERRALDGTKRLDNSGHVLGPLVRKEQDRNGCHRVADRKSTAVVCGAMATRLGAV